VHLPRCEIPNECQNGRLGEELAAHEEYVEDIYRLDNGSVERSPVRAIMVPSLVLVRLGECRG
jgi:hypothetical protein